MKVEEDEEDKRKRKQIEELEEESEEEEEGEESDEFESGSFDIESSSARGSSMLGNESNTANANAGEENLEGKLKTAEGAGKEEKKEKDEKVYFSEYDDRHKLYDLDIEQTRHVETASQRGFEKPARHDLDTISPMARKSELESRNASELTRPEHVKYQTEKGFFEFDPLRERKGHDREDLKKYRREH